MSITIKIPPAITVYRGQPRVASRVQDSTLGNVQSTNSALKQTAAALAPVQAATAAGTLASGALVLAVLPVTGTYTLIPHNLGRVASGFLVVGKSAPCDVFQDPQDPGCPIISAGLASRVGTSPTPNNRTPTLAIRLQGTNAGPTAVALWVF